jgi:hypothetical protein
VSYDAPAIKVLLYPGSPAGAEGTGIDLSSRLRSFAIQRGKDQELSEFQSGTASLVLDNTDGQLDYKMPLSIAASAGMESRIRIYAVRPLGGTDEIFNGYMTDGFKLITEGLSHDAIATVDLVDWLGWASGQDMPYMFEAVMRSQIATAHGLPGTWLTGLSPKPWFAGGSLVDNIYQPGPPPISGVGMEVLAGSPAEGSPIMPGSDIASVAMGPNTVLTQNDFTGGTPSTFMVSFRITGTPTNGTWVVVVRQTATTTSTLVQTLRVTTAGGLQFTVYDASGANPVTATVAAPAAGGRFDDGRLVCCICIVQANHVELWVPSDGGAGSTTHASSGTLGYALVSGGVAQLGTNGTQDTFEVAEFAAWNTIQTGMEDLVGAAVGRQAAWPFNFTSLSPLNLLIAFCQAAQAHSPNTQTASMYFDAAAGTTGWPSDRGLPSNLADAVRQIGTGAFGAAYMGRGAGPGYSGLVVRDWTFSDAARFSTPVANLTDDPAPAASPPVVRVTNRGRYGPVHSLLLSRVRYTVRDLASGRSGTFFKRALFTLFADVPRVAVNARAGESAIESPYVTGMTWLDDGAQDLLDRHKLPQFEIGDLTIQPWGDDAATNFVLHDLDLEKAVTYEERPRPYSVATARVSGTYRVISESWSWQNGRDWTVTVRLAPA